MVIGHRCSFLIDLEGHKGSRGRKREMMVEERENRGKEKREKGGYCPGNTCV